MERKGKGETAHYHRLQLSRPSSFNAETDMVGLLRNNQILGECLYNVIPAVPGHPVDFEENRRKRKNETMFDRWSPIDRLP
jgi:hypothetical protein